MQNIKERQVFCMLDITISTFSTGAEIIDHSELAQNLKEAIKLHFEDDPESLAGYAPNPSLFTMMDLGEIHVG